MIDENGAEERRLATARWLTEQWPVTAAALLTDLALWQQQSEPCDEDDFEILSLIVDEAARGVDVARRFPAFWARMMACAELHEAFLDALGLLVDSRAGRLRPLPGSAVLPVGDD